MAKPKSFAFSAPISGGGTTKPASWGTRFPGRGGDTGKEAFFIRAENLNSWLRSMEEDFRQALDEAEVALDRSLRARVLIPANRICPRDTGALRASGWVGTGRAGGWLQGAVGYDTDYALFVHENPNAYHQPPTRWKWLEETFARNGYKVAEDVLAAVVQELY